MRMKRKYEYNRELKQQSPEIKAMIAAGEKADELKAAKKKVAAKKKQQAIWRRAKRRLKKLFGE